MTEIDRLAIGILLVAAAEDDLSRVTEGPRSDLMRELLESVRRSDDPLRQARRVAATVGVASQLRRVLRELHLEEDPPATPRSEPPPAELSGCPCGPLTHLLEVTIGTRTFIQGVRHRCTAAIGSGEYLESLVLEDGDTRVELSVWGTEHAQARLIPMRGDA
jgi:hypothetical protein